MDVTSNFVQSVAKPLIVANSDGRILYINDSARHMLKKLIHRDGISSIVEIDTEYDRHFDYEYLKEDMFFDNLKIKVDIFQSKFNNKEDALVYLFDNVLFNDEVDALLNSIEYVVNVVNAEGAIEFFGEAGYEILGMSEQDTAPGQSLIKHYEGRSTITTEPTFYSALREKKRVVGLSKYITGVTLLNKAAPVFSKNGDIKRVLIIGQNVTETSALDEMLIRSGDMGKVLRSPIPEEVSKYLERENYVAASDEMKQTINTAVKAAPSDSSVFIWGESGVGKEMVARIIHNASRRKDGPFIPINCAAIPHELMESEFFGYEQGAFTGANAGGKKGLLEEADGGTVFLDELGEMPYFMQSKLLRAIQEQKIRKVGGNVDIPINVRYISATNLKAEEFMDNRILREDLYYRLAVILINVPPLRDRRVDIPLLIRNYLNYYNRQHGKFITISKAALKKLVDYDWPGNVRELRNVMQRIVLMAESELVDDVDLDSVNFETHARTISQKLYRSAAAPHEKPAEGGLALPDDSTWEEAQDALFNQMVKKAYEECGSVVKAAEKLGINPSTIHRKIKQGKLELSKPDKND